MNVTIDIGLLKSRLDGFGSGNHLESRLLSLYSASIATADKECMVKALDAARKGKITREKLYEIVLQSYLFLGFPRMLIAAETLDTIYPLEDAKPVTEKISRDESKEWFENGMNLYRRVYNNSFQPLQEKVESIAPEVFRWMIIEGYGKVLSRPGLDIVDRELSIAAFLMMESRDQQLYSHMRGAINVGAPAELLRHVVEDIGESAGDGYRTARELLRRMDID